MKKTLHIPIKALSLNAMYCRSRSFTTRQYKEWSMTFFHKIDTEDNIKKLEELREYFDNSIHAYNITITTFSPKNTVYTKEGKMSSRDFDRSNIEKPIIDLLFFPKYYDKPSPYGCKNLNIDDKYILDLSSKKRVSQGDSRIEIEIEIIPNGFKTLNPE